MPELPEVSALAGFLAQHAGGQRIVGVSVASLNVLTTYDPPPSALVGRVLTGARRQGKFLDLITHPDDDQVGPPLHLIVHLARAGWLRWSDNISAVPPKIGGPIALRVRFELGGFDITEAGTKKSVAAAIVSEPMQVPGIARLGPDAMGADGAGLEYDTLVTVSAGRTSRIKNVLTDQSVLAGIGNAYSDEILHTAKISPFATAGKLDDQAIRALHAAIAEVLSAAIARTEGAGAARLKGEKRTGLRVHARTGLPCPVCAGTVAEVSFADRSLQYCPICQTGGKMLADRRLSRLIK